MNKRYTLKIHLKSLGCEVCRIIEISGRDTLNDLCRVILDAFHFVDEHLYEFNMDNRMYGSEWSYQSDPEYDDKDSTDIKIDKLCLIKG